MVEQMGSAIFERAFVIVSSCMDGVMIDIREK